MSIPRDCMDRPAGKRNRFSVGDPVKTRADHVSGDPISPLADAEQRSRFATGQARYRKEWSLTKEKTRNVRIKPGELRRPR
jgi:hypothetical protein